MTKETFTCYSPLPMTEVSVELVPCFHNFNRFSDEADWYEFNIKSGGAQVRLHKDVVFRLSEIADYLMEIERRKKRDRN